MPREDVIRQKRFSACSVGQSDSGLCRRTLLAWVGFALHACVTPVLALPTGFQDSVVISGLSRPTAIRFAPDGRIFVTEKNGLIKVFDNELDTTATVFADLRNRVLDFGDAGLLSLAIDPAFPIKPHVYVLYTHDALIGGTSPLWNDTCDASNLGCVASGRLSRLTANGNVMAGTEVVLIEDWCQQYPGHSVGDLRFGPDGALYASGGDGGTALRVDYGQVLNACGDPELEGGALSSQDLLSLSDPVTLAGTLIRVNPDTGNAMPTNPLIGGVSDGDDRIIAFGLRNPFRFTFHPTRGDIWISDVGWTAWEEINRIPNPLDAIVENFGWPCYEGVAAQPSYDAAELPLCESLYLMGMAVAPHYQSLHQGTSALTGIAFHSGGNYPASYQGALFVADYGRRVIDVMFPGADGLPDPGSIANFASGSMRVVDLQTGPSGDLYYLDIDARNIHRIRYFPANQPPIAMLSTTPTSGPTPLTVTLDGGSSTDPDTGNTLTLAWDFDADSACDDAVGAVVTRTFTTPGDYHVTLCVTDNHGAQSTASVLIQAGNNSPVATIFSPQPGATWRVGDPITFSGAAVDPDTGPLLASAHDWELRLNHCHDDDLTDCHVHYLQSFPGVTSGQFPGVDHEYPVFLELSLTTTETPPADWWDTSWSARSLIHVDATGLSGPLADFPVMIRLNSTNLDYGRAQPDGADLRLVSASGELHAYEIDTWNTAGDSIIWVRLPVVGPGSASNIFWVYYGNPAAVAGQNPAATWPPSFAGVWHLGASLHDSTVHGNHGVNQGTTVVPGRLGDARFFNGVSTYVDAGAGASLNLTSALTVEAWVRITDPQLNKYLRIVSNREIFPLSGGYRFEYNPFKDALYLESDGFDSARGGAALDVNWHHVACAMSGGTARFYVDGVDVTTDPVLAPVTPSPLSLFIGNRAGGGVFMGDLDEVRVSNVSRSAEWMAVQFRSMNGQMVTFGPREYFAPLATTTTVRLDPETTTVTLDTVPSGLELVVYSESETTPAQRTVIVGGNITVSAPTTQSLSEMAYDFSSWSDGGAATHGVTVGAVPLTITATYAVRGGGCSQDSQNSAAFVNCMAGPAAVPASPCTCPDTDGDRDVDLADFARFQVNFSHDGAE